MTFFNQRKKTPKGMITINEIDSEVALKLTEIKFKFQCKYPM